MSSRRTPSAGLIIGLGSRIKAAREAMGWTQAELGKAVGVSRSAVSQWEKGAVQNLKLGNLFLTAEVLRTDVQALVFGEVRPMRVAEERGSYGNARPQQHVELLQGYGQLPRSLQATLHDLIITLARECRR